MNKKKHLFLRIGSIVDYVVGFIYIFFAAYAFSLRDNLYWMFFAFGLSVIFAGLALSSFIHRFPLDDKKKRIEYFLAVGFSIFAIAPTVLGILAYLDKGETGPIVRETAEEKIETNQENPEEVKEPQSKKDKVRAFFKKRRVIVACSSLVLIGLAGFSGAAFETNGFQVSVTDFRLTKAMTDEYNDIAVNGVKKKIQQDDVSYAVTLYKPKFASETKKASTVFVIPGFTRTKLTMTQYAIELSKRGSAVFVIDPGSQGASTNSGYNPETGEQRSYAYEANGANYLVQYVYNNTDAFPYLDRTRFGVMGHSAGGGNAVTVAETFAGSSYEQSVIKALYISGYIKVGAADKYHNLHCNAANSYAYYDEGAYRYQTETTSVEAINSRFINEVNGENLNRVVEYDKPFGSMEDGTYRILHREETNHCFEMYDGTSITNTIAFFREAFRLNAKVADSSHTWLLKEGSNGIGLVAGFAFLLSVAGILVELPFLRSIKGKKIVLSNGEYAYEGETPLPKRPSSIPSRFSFTGKAIFWGTSILTAIVACLDYIPLAYLSMKWFPDAANNVFTTVFPARMFNAVLLWAGFNGLLGIILFFGAILLENLIEHFLAKKQGREAIYDWSKLRPLKIHPLDLLKTLGLGIALFFLFYGVVQLSYTLFHQDFRFMLISTGTLSPRFLLTWLEYIPFLFIFYFSNSLKVNCSVGLEGWKEWQVYLASALMNSLGLVFILVVNYASFFVTGEVFYGYMGADKAEVWLYVNMVFALIPMMALLPICNRVFYRFTNRVYLGPLVTVMVFAFMSLAGTISYMPL